MRARIVPTLTLLVLTSAVGAAVDGSEKVPPPSAGVAAAKVPSQRAAPPWAKVGGVSLIVRFDEKTATILSAQTASHPPRKGASHKPQLTAETADRYPVGTKELVIAAYRRDGTLLQAIGRPSRALLFHDEHDRDRRERLRGRPYAPRVDQRFLDIPLADDASFLAFFRTEVVPLGDRAGAFYADHPAIKVRSEPALLLPGDAGRVRHAIRVSFLSMYSLYPFPDENRTGPPPSLRKPRLPRLFGPPIEHLARFRMSLEHMLMIEIHRMLCPSPLVTLAALRLLAQSSVDDGVLDVAILGDGFTDSEQGAFNDGAKKVQDALLSAEPFLSLKSFIRFHTIWTPSQATGIKRCSRTDPAAPTYFGVEGRWTDPYGEEEGACYFGTPLPCFIDRIVGTVIPRDQVELVIVLANCKCPPEYGGESGDADMENGIVYFSMPVSDPGLILHESAHVIAMLGEEYVSCVPPGTPNSWNLYAFPNVASQDDVDHNKVLWKPLARSDELTDEPNYEDKKFRAVQECGHAYAGTACVPDKVPASLRGSLGLFWGAMYADKDASHFDECLFPRDYCDQYCSSNCNASCYYRPMNECRMVDTSKGYCTVCDCALRKAIWRAAPGSSSIDPNLGLCKKLPDLP